jgi:hypothetical protein
MKFFTKLLLLALVAALVAPFFIKGKNGEPLLNFNDFVSGNTAISGFEPKKPTKMYKWKNSKGEWQFGDTPPEDSNASEMHVKTQINSMKTIELPDGFKDQQDADSNTQFDPLESNASPFSTAPLEKVPEMLNQIEDYQQKLDDRAKLLDSL